MPDPTLDRLYRHAAWATDRTIAHLLTLPEATLGLATPGRFAGVAALSTYLPDDVAARLPGGIMVEVECIATVD